MKLNKLTYLLVGALLLTMSATGCRKKTTPLTNLPGYRTGSAGDPGAAGLPGAGTFRPDDIGSVALPDDLNDLSRFNQDRSTLATHIVHFDFDSSVVKSSEKPHVEAVAQFMKSAPPGVALLVEGHCDERGTEEYNRSLGERRALALREALISSGADGGRMTTRSFGEDVPAVDGHDESAWKQNRRGEFIVLTPK